VAPKGVNLLGRWTRRTSAENSWSAQAYYDQFQRDDVYLKQKFKVFDLDFQQNLKFLDRHDLVWGGNYRQIESEFSNSFMISIFPAAKTNRLFSFFAQDQIALIKNKLSLTVGSKFEKNDFTDFEVQPSARLLWKPQSHHIAWAALSRALRTPSQIEDNGRIVLAVIPQANPTPPPATLLVPYAINGNQALSAERILAYEIGYRFLPSDKFDLDLAIFYNDYQNIINAESAGNNQQFANGIEGESYGLEATLNWQARDWLDTELSYTFIELNMRSSTTNDINQKLIERSSPKHQASLKTSFRLPNNLNLHLWGRYVGKTKNLSTQGGLLSLTEIDDYFEMDCSLSWQASEKLEITLSGRNLLDDRHTEFISESFIAPIEVERRVFAKLNWKF
jgi:iron complex outermembrane receptor protein